jgi:hypothetical protein
MLRAFNVWAYHSEFEQEYGAQFCADARLHSGRAITAYPDGNVYGQAGWHMAVPFTYPGDLFVQLTTLELDARYHHQNLRDRGRVIQHGEIHRLAIFVHGGPARAYLEGRSSPPITLAGLEQNADMRGDLVEIGRFTAQQQRTAVDPLTMDRPFPVGADYPPSIIMFVGCRLAQGDAGSQLLRRLSRLWPNRTVVGFNTYGLRPSSEAARRPGSNCFEPGMLETHMSDHPSRAVRNRYIDDYLEPLPPDQLPWVSEHSAYAKWARNGEIVPGHEGAEGTPSTGTREARRRQPGGNRGPRR